MIILWLFVSLLNASFNATSTRKTSYHRSTRAYRPSGKNYTIYYR